LRLTAATKRIYARFIIAMNLFLSHFDSSVHLLEKGLFFYITTAVKYTIRWETLEM
jgi:hypothetical protein